MDAVSSIESCVFRVSRGVALANQAGESITQIKAKAFEVAQVVSDISDSLKVQSVACNAIARNVEKIAQMTKNNRSAQFCYCRQTPGTVGLILASYDQALQDLATAISAPDRHGNFPPRG